MLTMKILYFKNSLEGGGVSWWLQLVYAVDGTELWGWQGKGGGNGMLPAKESRSDLHVEAAWGAALKLQSWLNANLKEIAEKWGEKWRGDVLAVKRNLWSEGIKLLLNYFSSSACHRHSLCVKLREDRLGRVCLCFKMVKLGEKSKSLFLSFPLASLNVWWCLPC